MSAKKYVPPHLRDKKASNQHYQNEIGNNYDEKQRNNITFENNRVHEPQLVLNVEYVDWSTTHHKSHYDKLSKSERGQVNDILLKIYDIYQPLTVDTNCGHKTNNSDKGQIHWKFNYNIDQYKTLLTHIIKKINKKNANDIQIMKNHLNHFNTKHAEFLDIKHRENFIYLEDDINSYKSLLNEVSVNNIKFKVDFKNIDINLNDTNFDNQSTSFFIKIQTDKNDIKQLKMVDYTKQINDALEKFVTFIHQTRDLIKNHISKINNKNSYKYNQPLEWFELTIGTKEYDDNVFIIIKCTVTILHFMLILSQSQKYDDIQRWFQKYCLFVEQSNQIYNQHKVTKAECFDKNHCVIQFAQHDKTLQSYNYKHIRRGQQNAQIEVKPNNSGGTYDWNKARNSRKTIMNNQNRNSQNDRYNEYNSKGYSHKYNNKQSYNDKYDDHDYDAINKNQNHSKRNTKY